MNNSASPTSTNGGGGADTTVTNGRPARGENGSSKNRNKACNPVITALAASSALSLQVTSTFLCHSFITVQAKPGELLAIVRTSVQEARTVASMGIFSIGDFYALSAYNEDGNVDFMWKLARVFGAVSLAMGGMATLVAWATTTESWYPACTPSCACTTPSTLTGSIWTVIAAFGAMAALLQVPTFLILESYPCADFPQQQSCHLAIGSYLTMASVVAWIVVTALTQLLDPPLEWATARNNLEHWRVVPKANTAGESTQQDEEDNVESSTCEDDIFNQVEEGEISGIHDDEDDDEDGSQDPIFSPRPREGHGNCFVSSSAASMSSSTSFWDGLLPWRTRSSSSRSISSAPHKAWQRCVKSPTSKSSNRGGASSQSHRVVQRFSYASAVNGNNSNNNHHTSRGPLNGDLRESSMLVEEAVDSSYDESTITFESTTDPRKRPKTTTTNWAGLVQASSPYNDDSDNLGPPQARGVVDPQQIHVVELQRQRDQQAPQEGHYPYDYPLQVLRGSSEWDKPEGIVPAEESLTASSFRTSSSGRDSPITGDESILDKADNADKHDSSSSSSSSSSVSSVADSQQGSSAINSQDEEQVKAVAVNGVPIYKDLLAEDEKKQDLNDSERHQQQHQRHANLLLSGEDADDEHDDLDEENNNDNPLSSSSGGGLTEDPFFSELPGASTILHSTSSSVGGGGGGYNFLDITSNTNMTNNTTNTTTTTSRFMGVALLSGMAGFRTRGGGYYPFENDDDDDDDYELNHSRGPPIAEVQIYNHNPNHVEAAGSGSVLDDSILDTIHPVSSSSEQELLQAWNDLFDFDDDPHPTTLEDYRQESFVTSLEENVSSIDQDDRLKSASVENKDNAGVDALDDDGQQQQQRPDRGRTMEHDADRTGGETSDSSDNNNNNNARELKRRQMIAAVVRRTNGGSSGVTLRPRRQHRRGRHNSDSVSSATSLLSFTIEEETARDLIEERGSSDLDGGGHYDYDKEIIERARRVKESIPLYRAQSLPYPATDSSVISDGESDITRPLHHRAASLPRGKLLDAQEDRVDAVQSPTDKDLKQEQKQNDEGHNVEKDDSIDQPISLQRRRSRSLEVDRKKSKRRTASRSLSPDRSMESYTRNCNKNMWRVDREARSAIHNLPVISLSESSDDDNAAVAEGSMTTGNKIASSGPNRARLARIQRLQREREQQQQQPKDPPVTQDPPLTPIVMMDDTTDASSEVVDDTTIETVEPMPPQDQGQLLLHCALTPPRRGGSSSMCSSRSGGGGLDDSVASSSADDHESSYLLDTLEVSLAELQREDEMEYGPDENSI